MNKVFVSVTIAFSLNSGMPLAVSIAQAALLTAQAIGQNISCNGQKYQANITWLDTTPRITFESKPSGKGHLRNAPARRVSSPNGNISYIARGETATTVTFVAKNKCSLIVKTSQGKVTVQEIGQTQILSTTSQNLQTVLAFQTQSYKVRVYRQNGQLYMNLYDKQGGYLTLDSMPAKDAPKRGDDDNWTGYIYQEPQTLQEGQLIQIAYIARLNPNGQLELEVIRNGTTSLIEKGY